MSHTPYVIVACVAGIIVPFKVDFLLLPDLVTQETSVDIDVDVVTDVIDLQLYFLSYHNHRFSESRIVI